MPDIQRICVFCGSNFGRGDIYRDATASLGRVLAQNGIEIVYGGTHKGLLEFDGEYAELYQRQLLEEELERAYEKIRSDLSPDTRSDLVADAVLSFDEVNDKTWQDIATSCVP